jgi:hypothetical protein
MGPAQDTRQVALDAQKEARDNAVDNRQDHLMTIQGKVFEARPSRSEGTILIYAEPQYRQGNHLRQEQHL